MDALADPLPKETFYFLLEKVGAGFRANGVYRTPGLLRMTGLDCPRVHTGLSAPFADVKRWISQKCPDAVCVPYVCDLQEGGEYCQAVFVGASPDLRAKLKAAPTDMCGSFVPEKTWADELSPEEYSARC